MWEDNFDNPILNETQHWTVEVNGDGGGNNEMQYYRRENISIEQESSGVNCLVISAKRENFGGKFFTSGRLVTRGNVSCKYGKIEARIKLPHTGNGLWPAFWMLGEDFPTIGWPRCGEIDILEMGNVDGISQGIQDRFMNGACHWGETWTYNAQNSIAAYSLQDDFHLFTLIWNESDIKMYLDLDKYPNASPYYTMSIVGEDVPGNVSHYFHKSFGILFNLAVGGTYTGIMGDGNISKITALPADGTPAKMYIDYVRIYQKGIAGEEFYGPSGIVDTEIPTAFTATKGTVTQNSVELLLNATDNSGSVYYSISYNGTTIIVKGDSGIQKSYIITGLSESTDYSFSVSVKDAVNNQAINNPQIVSVKTIAARVLDTIDFETIGQDWSWTLFNNGTSLPELYSVVSNPNASGINNSANCAKYIVNIAAEPWAGLWSTNIGEFTFSASNCVVKVMVYKDIKSDFDLKFEGAGGTPEVKVPNTLVGEWQLLTLDFSSQIGKTFNKLVIIPDFPTTRTSASTNYWDNISFHSYDATIVSNINTTKLLLFPNPITNKLQIKSGHEISQIIVRNLLGQILISTKLNNREFNLDLSNIPAGNLIVTVILANGQLSTQKIVKL